MEIIPESPAEEAIQETSDRPETRTHQATKVQYLQFFEKFRKDFEKQNKLPNEHLIGLKPRLLSRLKFNTSIYRTAKH